MQLPVVLCCIFVTITVAATWAEADDVQGKEVYKVKTKKKISKRDTIMVEEYANHDQLPKVVNHNRKSTTAKKIVPLKTKYGSAKMRYKTIKPKPNRKSNKRGKNRKPHINYANALQKQHKQNAKARYRHPSKPFPKPRYEVPDFGHPVFEGSDFGEPPQNYDSDFKPPKTSYGEPPLEYNQPAKYAKNVHLPWADNLDANFAFSNKHVSYVNPDADTMFEIYNVYKPKYFTDHSKVIKQAWKLHQKQLQDGVIVGGQYAEPPPRFAPRPMLQNKQPPQSFAKFGSPSPYVNYKNGNIAFSPQNLNDAFSIVDK